MTKLRTIYEKYFLISDAILSLIILLIVFFIDLKAQLDIFDKSKNILASLYAQITTISITLFGFVLTSVSIIIAFLQNPKLEELSKSELSKTIINTYFNTIIFSLVLAVISFFAQLSWNITASILIFWIISLIALIFSTRILRCIWIMKEMSCLLYKLKEKSNPT